MPGKNGPNIHYIIYVCRKCGRKGSAMKRKLTSILCVLALLLALSAPALAAGYCPARAALPVGWGCLLRGNCDISQLLALFFPAQNEAAPVVPEPKEEPAPVVTQPAEEPAPAPVVTQPEEVPAPVPAEDAAFTQQAQDILALVNQERAANGLAPLALDETLCAVAQTKADDLHDNRYFSHTSPTYGSPYDLMGRYGIRYRSAGENIAMGYASAERVMAAWMDSAGHRANILSASYGKLGVGYVASGGYWVQEFTD